MNPKGTDASAVRDEFCIPLARKIVKILGNHADDLPLGNNITQEQRLDVYGKIFTEIMTIFLEVNIKTSWIDHTMNLVRQSFGLTSDMIVKSNEKNESVATRVLWKLHDMADLSIGDIDTIIKGQPLNRADVTSGPSDVAPADETTDTLASEETMPTEANPAPANDPVSEVTPENDPNAETAAPATDTVSAGDDAAAAA